MPELVDAGFEDLVAELQSRGKASLIALVPKTKADGDNPYDDIDLFTEGTLADRGWLLTALQTVVMGEIAKAWEPDEDDECETP